MLTGIHEKIKISGCGQISLEAHTGLCLVGVQGVSADQKQLMTEQPGFIQFPQHLCRGRWHSSDPVRPIEPPHLVETAREASPTLTEAGTLALIFSQELLGS